jgi:hypothetical protein
VRGFGARLLLFGGLGNPNPAPTGGIWSLVRLFEARFLLVRSVTFRPAPCDG